MKIEAAVINLAKKKANSANQRVNEKGKIEALQQVGLNTAVSENYFANEGKLQPINWLQFGFINLVCCRYECWLYFRFNSQLVVVSIPAKF